MKMTRVKIAGFMLLANAATDVADAGDAAAAAEGQALLETHCARCHAIGKTDKSPLKNAPPLRDIYRQYPVVRLEFELSEGIGSRHRDMPQIQFSTEQIDKILEFLKSQADCD